MQYRESRRQLLSKGAIAACSMIGNSCNRPDVDRYGNIEHLIADAAKQHNVPGVSLAIVANAKTVWSKGIGLRDKSSNEAVTADTIFEAASMSKPIFAYAVMKMRERGIIKLDVPLTRYTTERFLLDDPRLENITARHVLAHTSGLQDIRSRKDPLKLHFAPGEKWQYSGEGYAYLQSVMTKLAGRQMQTPCERFETDLQVCATDFDSYMKTNVLAPLGMASSGYLAQPTTRRGIARPHDGQGRPMPERTYTSAPAVARYGAMGGLLTTAPDYANFLIALMEPKPADDHHLTQASIAEMLKPHIKVQDGQGFSISWALGWKVAHTSEFGELVSHGGDQPGFHCLAEMSPSRKSGYVILTNGENGWKLIQQQAPILARIVHAGVRANLHP